AIDFNQPADNSLRSMVGLEWQWEKTFALRAGYNINADLLKLSAGAGFFAKIGGTQSTIDYSYTDGGSLGGVNRLSLGLSF
ncbi:MAG TPA: hypothetical protein VMJ70_15795, partial [Candidatus Sulfotelmatobacter sp.]|nr:hypothetical protein [Candidatus Sulfotelmatobacter sp.]